MEPMATTEAAFRSTVVSVDLAALPLAGRTAFARLHAVKSDADVLSTGIVKTEPKKTKPRISMSDLHPEVKPVFRGEVIDRIKEERITQPYFTKYEYTTLVAARAQQIAEGAKPLVELKGLNTSDPMFIWNVAKREIEQRKLPYVIRRGLPDNTSEFWSAQELEVMW